jgi:hypothetical protein
MNLLIQSRVSNERFLNRAIPVDTLLERQETFMCDMRKSYFWHKQKARIVDGNKFALLEREIFREATV